MLAVSIACGLRAVHVPKAARECGRCECGKAKEPTRAHVIDDAASADLLFAALMSRYTSCPICGKQVPLLLINDHLDSVRQCVAPAPAASSSHSSSSSSAVKRPAASIGSPPQVTKAAKASPPLGRSVVDALRPLNAAAFEQPIRYRGSPKETWRAITKTEMQRLAPLVLQCDVLPAADAASLLRWLHEDAEQWERSQWIVHGKEHSVPRTSTWFALGGDGSHEISDSNVNVYGRHGTRSAPPELQSAAAAVTELVRRLRPGVAWAPSGALANRYRDGDETVGPHSDFMNQLGPRPIIVGLSLGAARRFDFQETAPPGGGPGGAAVRVTLPHNSALIMWDDAQECWTHSVPRCAESSVGRHPISGLERISLTFRMKRTDLPPLPSCFCGVPAALKGRGRGEAVQYWLFCDPSRAPTLAPARHEAASEDAQGSTGGHEPVHGKQCGFRQRFEWAEREATRLRALTAALEE